MFIYRPTPQNPIQLRNNTRQIENPVLDPSRFEFFQKLKLLMQGHWCNKQGMRPPSSVSNTDMRCLLTHWLDGGSILGVSFLDPLAGLVVSGMIFKAGAQTGYQSILELVDAAIPSHDLDSFRKTVVQVDGVKGCRHLRGRRAGSTLYLDVKILVDPFCSISKAHQIGENVRHQIQNSHPEFSEVFIQLEPTKQKITELMYDSSNLESEHHGIEGIIIDMLTTKFSEKMAVKRITKRMIQDKVLLEVEVSMPPDFLISDTMEVAEEAKSHILQATNNSIEATSAGLNDQEAINFLEKKMKNNPEFSYDETVQTAILLCNPFYKKTSRPMRLRLESCARRIQLFMCSPLRKLTST